MTPLTFFKCLAEDTRLRILLLISSEGELCVAELTKALNEIQPKISRHLSQLRDCGILTYRKQGQWVFYALSPDLPEWCIESIQQTVKNNPDYIKQNYQLLCEMKDRPERPGACC